MASSSSSLSALIVLLLIFHHILCVKSNEALINVLCGQLSDPPSCLSCHHPRPSSENADAKALVLNSSGCAEKSTASMLQKLVAMNLLTSLNSPIKTIMEHCVSNASAAVQAYDKLTSHLNRQAYAAAKQYIVQNVMPFSNACLEEFNQHPEQEAPPYVVSVTQTVNRDIEVVMGILNNI